MRPCAPGGMVLVWDNPQLWSASTCLMDMFFLCVDREPQSAAQGSNSFPIARLTKTAGWPWFVSFSAVRHIGLTMLSCQCFVMTILASAC